MTWWTHHVTCLSCASGGMPPKRLRQLYNTVAVPAFTYAADIWYLGPHLSPKGLKCLGSVAITKKLTSIQQRITRAITGALSMTAGNVLETHANLLPIDLLFNKVIFRAATRIATLPPSHPLFSLSYRAAKRYVQRHRSPLHNLFHSTGVIPDTVKTINTICRCPNYIPSFETTIVRGCSASSDVSSDISPSPLYIPPHHR